MALSVYPNHLTDAAWALLSPFLPPAKPGGRPRSIDLRRILNGLFYLVRTGCAWRYLPRDYGSWSTVYHYFRQFRRDGTGERVHARLRELARERAGGRDALPCRARRSSIVSPVGPTKGDHAASRIRRQEDLGT
jgi:putative transposase